jgi:glycosyltransferase involved in cell wall biosynthesis
VTHGGGPVDISVVIPVLDGEDTLPTQLQALADQRCDLAWEVVVADNGSTDGTRAVVEAHRSLLPALQVVDASDRPGPSHARNVGAVHATGRWLVFVDSDDEVAPGYLAAMGAALAQHPFVGARIDHEAFLESDDDGVRDPFQSDGLLETGLYPATGAGASAMWRSTFEELGGYDESLSHGEDLDLSWRAQLAGIPLAFAGDAVLRYRPRPGVLALCAQERAWGRADVVLYERYRDAGLRRTLGEALLGYLRVGRHLLLPRNKQDLVWGVVALGRVIGHVEQSIRLRIFHF